MLPHRHRECPVTLSPKWQPNRRHPSMIRDPKQIAKFPPGPPLLQVVVDTEEEFDWSQPFDRSKNSVSTISAQHLAQQLFAPYGLKPTYVIDYPVATTPDAVAVLRSFVDADQCQIGAHLHPWVNPPFEELVSPFTSYPGNLEPALERAKLERLTEAIEAAFGARPAVYKAGRYGVGPNTAITLEALGYLVDLSVVPHTDFGADGGPDFRSCPDRPYWVGDRGPILEIPLSRGYCGLAAGFGRILQSAAHSNLGQRCRLGGALARSRLLERVTLTPEGCDFDAQSRLVRALLRGGQRIFTLSYHSPSLVPGHTPYVRNQADLAAFLDTIKRCLSFFFEELNAEATTPLLVRTMASHPFQARTGPAITSSAKYAP
jgi:hypothetical protein